ncbi:MAG: CvpA family protein [Paludibacteraceae bacterium]|nr:CvpA family protein [Paludibacteraceae bacterium]
MNWLDVLLLLPLLVGLVRGLMRGLISEIIAILVLIFGVLGARYTGPEFSRWLLHQFAWPQAVCDVVAYTLIFLGIAIVLTIIARGLTKFIRAIHLSWANRVFGGIIGLIKYGLAVLIVIFIMDRTNQAYHWLDDWPVARTSVVYHKMVKIERVLVQKAMKIDI